jgi:hypothetical protein
VIQLKCVCPHLIVPPLYRPTTVPLYRLQVYHIDQDVKQAEGEIRGLREELAEAERSLQASQKNEKKIELQGLLASSLPADASHQPRLELCRPVSLPAARCLMAGILTNIPALPCCRVVLSLPLQVSERAAEEKKREQAGLQKERLLLEKKIKKRQAEADKKVGGGWGWQRRLGVSS